MHPKFRNVTTCTRFKRVQLFWSIRQFILIFFIKLCMFCWFEGFQLKMTQNNSRHHNIITDHQNKSAQSRTQSTIVLSSGNNLIGSFNSIKLKITTKTADQVFVCLCECISNLFSSFLKNTMFQHDISPTLHHRIQWLYVVIF